MVALFVLILPLISFCAISLCLLPYKRASIYTSILGILISFLISTKIAVSMVMNQLEPSELSLSWIAIGETTIQLGIVVDTLSVMMLVVVCLVSLLIQIYSIGYMQGDPGISRYYAFLSLFSFSMLLLVLSANFIQMFIAWELVGLCSYLLIGFWYQKESASSAGKKAFITTRIGDVGFLIGILLIFKLTGTLNFSEFSHIIEERTLSDGIVAGIALLVFCGAIGKSAQFPLHIWLPDAMEGPTPVSALIHAATMVAAGVYLVARLFFLFSASPSAMEVVAFIGGFTAIFSATIAIAQNDIKRIIAYSTLSQLGYMMLALGSAGYTAGCFHLFTHAFFKALLFLCAGSVIHAIHSNDIWKAGGLIHKMPITGICFLVGGLSLAGVPPFSGFFSKDEILVAVHSSKNLPLFVMAIVTVFLTSLYIFRAFFVLFWGEEREDVHESPSVMTIPMVILAILSLTSGWFHTTFSSLIQAEGLHSEHPVSAATLGIMVSSLSMAFFGILVAFVIYGKKRISSEKINQIFSAPCTLLTNKYWIDELYEATVVKAVRSISSLSGWFDLYIVDGLVNGTAYLTATVGRVVRLIQTGFVQSYISIMVIGAILLILLFL